MLRNLLIAAALALPVSLAAAPEAAAGPISLNNPYRSFNVTGVNYGSVRWEQTHGHRTSSARHAWTPRRTGGFFRRR